MHFVRWPQGKKSTGLDLSFPSSITYFSHILGSFLIELTSGLSIHNRPHQMKSGSCCTKLKLFQTKSQVHNWTPQEFSYSNVEYTMFLFLYCLSNLLVYADQTGLTLRKSIH